MTAVMEPDTQLKPETVDRATELLEVYQAEREGMVRRAVRFAGGRDQAEDAVQDAFVALLTNPAQVRNAAAYVQSHSRGWALRESTRRSQQVPVGDALAWQPDTAPPAEDLDTLSACMGDPVVVAAVRKALAKLPARQAAAIRMRMLERRSAADVAAEFGVNEGTIRRDIRLGLEALRAMNIPLPEIEPEPPVAPTSGRRSVPTIEELTATLDREHPGVWIGPSQAEETLRLAHGKCSTVRAVRAQKTHNVTCEKPAAKNRATGSANGAAKRKAPTAVVTPVVAAEGTVVTTAPVTRAVVTTVQVPAPATASRAPVVAEVWLMGAKPPISCLLVHADETTTNRDLAAVSLSGAQREITGQLIGDGYRPDGPWIDVDPAAPEAMRKFHIGGQS